MSGSEAKIQVFPTFATKLLAVQKRSGETVPFDARKIFDAIKKAVATTEEISDEDIVKITQNALDRLDAIFAGKTPSVEVIQDTVIQSLMDAHAYKTAEAYIIYRQKRSEIRNSTDRKSVV